MAKGESCNGHAATAAAVAVVMVVMVMMLGLSWGQHELVVSFGIAASGEIDYCVHGNFGSDALDVLRLVLKVLDCPPDRLELVLRSQVHLVQEDQVSRPDLVPHRRALREGFFERACVHESDDRVQLAKVIQMLRLAEQLDHRVWVRDTARLDDEVVWPLVANGRNRGLHQVVLDAAADASVGKLYPPLSPAEHVSALPVIAIAINGCWMAWIGDLEKFPVDVYFCNVVHEGCGAHLPLGGLGEDLAHQRRLSAAQEARHNGHAGFASHRRGLRCVGFHNASPEGRRRRRRQRMAPKDSRSINRARLASPRRR
mmetsp:Transcript_198/g.399  ORF Transcript_198/g.399 Transcript_198/m.399 type:complete len:313 (-) Transcript_198:32-970(-)